MNKLTGEFEIGDRVTIHKWHHNVNLNPIERLIFPAKGTIKHIYEKSDPKYGIKIDGIPEELHNGADNLWWFHKKEFSLYTSPNPFITKSFFTGKDTTPPKTKEIPEYKIVDVEHGRYALVTEEKVYFFVSATEQAIKESFEEHGEDIPLSYYEADPHKLEELFDEITGIEAKYKKDFIQNVLGDFRINILTFKVGCQKFTINDLYKVVNSIASF